MFGWVSMILFGILSVSHAHPVPVSELRQALPGVWQRLGPERFSEIVSYLNELTDRLADAPISCGGRLTLTSGVPFTADDVTAATTVYFSPFLGNKISLYNGSRWVLYSFRETSVAVPSTTNKSFDIYGYANSGALALETVNWTNNTTRATAVTTVDGVHVKSGDATRRYLGTGRTTASTGEAEDSYLRRFLWNYCNRRKRIVMVKEAENPGNYWGYQSATWRRANGNTANRIELVAGLEESFLNLTVHGSVDGGGDTNAQAHVAISEDSTSTPHSRTLGRLIFQNSGATILTGIGSLRTYPSEGYHYYQWLERTGAAASCTIYGYDLCGSSGTPCMFTGIAGWYEG